MYLHLSLALLTPGILSSAMLCSATTIASNTAGMAGGLSGYVGQSFVVTPGSSYDDITLAFLGTSGQNLAVSTGFLFSSAYTGTPGALNASTAGLLGTASSAGGLYSFAPALTLTGGSTYYFYENGLFAGVTGNNIYTGGQAFFTTSSTTAYTSQGVSDNFRVTGDAVAATPEPASLALLGTGVLGIAGILKRRLTA